MFHDESGFPTNDSEKSDKFLRQLYDKVGNHRDELCLYDLKNEGKGRVCIVAYGSCARSARAALNLADKEGLAVEVLHLYTLFPLARRDIQTIARRVEFILIPELNLGQYAREVRRLAEKWTTVISMNRIDGNLITPEEILSRITQLVGKYERV